MSSLKFFKGTFNAGTSYVNGGIYFDNTSHEIRVGNATGGYDAFGSGIKSVSLAKGAHDADDQTSMLVIEFFDASKSNISIDLSDVASASSVSSSIEAINTTLGGKLDSITNADQSITIGGTSVAPTVAVNISSVEGNTLEVKNDGLYVSVPTITPYTGGEGISINDHEVSINIAAGDKVLTATEQGVVANVAISYDSDAKQIKLTGKDNNVLGTVDCTAFVKDGMLSSAEIVDVSSEEAGTAGFPAVAGKYLKLSFNTDGDQDPLFVALSELIDIYTGGKDIAVSEGNVIDISLDAPITCVGLSGNVGHLANGTVIPAGKSLSEILKMMLCKTLNPKAPTKPSITLNSSQAVGVKEIYSTVDIGVKTISKNDGKFNSNGWTSPAQPAVAGVEWSNENISATKNSGFSNFSTSVGGNPQTGIVVGLGSNSVTYSASASYTAPSNKPINNLGEEYDGSEATWVAGNATATCTVTATGVYPCYTNISGGTYIADPTTKLGLTQGKEFTFTDIPTHIGKEHKFTFAYPNTHTVSKFQIKDLTGAFVDYAGDHTKSAGTISKTLGGIDVTYNTLTIDGAQGSGTFKVILDKNLNS